MHWLRQLYVDWAWRIPFEHEEEENSSRQNIATLPRQIHSDQKWNFQSNLFCQLCQLLDIDQTRTTQSDGMVERLNQGMLSRFTSSNQKDWDSHYVMMAYRSAVHDSTG